MYFAAAGFGIAIVPQSMSQLGPGAVTFKPPSGDGPEAPLAFARDTHDPSPAVLNLEVIVREVL